MKTQRSLKWELKKEELDWEYQNDQIEDTEEGES